MEHYCTGGTTMLMERYQQAVEDLLKKVRDTQTEAIERTGKLFAETVAAGGCIHLGKICHEIEHDLIYPTMISLVTQTEHAVITALCICPRYPFPIIFVCPCLSASISESC